MGRFLWCRPGAAAQNFAHPAFAFFRADRSGDQITHFRFFGPALEMLDDFLLRFFCSRSSRPAPFSIAHRCGRRGAIPRCPGTSPRKTRSFRRNSSVTSPFQPAERGGVTGGQHRCQMIRQFSIRRFTHFLGIRRQFAGLRQGFLPREPFAVSASFPFGQDSVR